MKPFLSARYLAQQVGVPLGDLKQLAATAPDHYREWSTFDEKKNKTRTLKVPDESLKFVQRRILRRVLDRYTLSSLAHGGVKGKSPKTNASCHVGQQLVVTQDIRDFYPSISHRQVASMFVREFGCGKQTTWLLTRLTTVDGQVPQGAPTSNAIANILLNNTIDSQIDELADDRGVTVSRYVDDFTYSGSQADTLINDTAKLASGIGLSTWRKRGKLEIMPASGPQIVTGFTVNSPRGPSVPKFKRDRVRAAISQLHNLPTSEAKKMVLSINGRLNHIRESNPGSASRLKKQLEQVLTERDLLFQ